MTWDRDSIDAAYARFSDNFVDFADVIGEFEDDSGRMHVTRLEIETPVEIGLKIQSDGAVEMGAAPPIYRTETTILPIFHNLRLTLEPSRNHSGEGE